MALLLSGLEHRYGAHASLHGVTLQVRRGDCYGFIGHNGAGKTTALRIALGLLRPRAGRVVVDGFDAERYPLEARARMGGLIEIPGFEPAESGLGNLVELGRLAGMPRLRARGEAWRALELVSLTEHARRRVGHYSQGMRQRLGIAQALLGAPPYLLLDEPTNGLDPEGIAELRAILTRLIRDERMTILLSSHQLAEVEGLCNRIGVLREGRLLVEAPTAELLASARRHYRVAVAGGDLGAALAAQGIETLERLERGAVVDLAAAEPAATLRALLAAGVEVDAFAPRQVTLEEIYLELAEQPPRAVEPAVVTVGAPARALAAPRPVARMAWFELRRVARRPGTLALLALPAAVAAWRVAAVHGEFAEQVARVVDGELFSATSVTGFAAFGLALQDAVPFAALAAVVLASQSIAGDVGTGTLRNVLLRPLRRRDAAVGKALAWTVAAAASYGAVVAVGFAAAALLLGFGDCQEVFRTAEPQLLVAAAELWSGITAVVLEPALPVVAFAALGLLAGTLVRSGVRALAFGLLAFVALDLGRVVARRGDFEWAMPGAYLPLFAGDTSAVASFTDSAQGIAGAARRFGEHGAWVALAWSVSAILLSAALLARRAVR